MKKLTLLVAACFCSVVILAENVTQKRAQQTGLAFLSGITHNNNQPMRVRTNVHIDDVSRLPEELKK